ncbi:MAG: Type pilus assembly protein PilM, type pilus assembly protein PilM [Parcubacteria group bacterium]|nr:Type pilus assembly protein PilM, type pilus assembly protein PilM [Parcubacteria group bacterium]
MEMALFNFFAKPLTSVIGIDIGSSAIKIVQIKKQNGQAVLETYGELSLGPYANATIGQAVILPPEKIANALVDLMREKEVNVTTNKCGISIPFASSLMSVIEMPAVSTKQLGLMVPIEARKYIPVPISEVALDWSIVPRSEVKIEDYPEGTPPDTGLATPVNIPKVDILVVAIHNDTIARYTDIVQKAGLAAGFFEIEIFSTMRAVLDDTLSPVMIMDMGAASTKLYIVERGITKASHTVNRGSQDITSNISKSLGLPLEKSEIMKRQIGATGEDKTMTEIIRLTLDYIFEEANHALLSFEKKYNKTVSKVILVGGGAALKGLSELAKANFNTDTVQANPFNKLATPAFLENILKETGPEFAVAIGAALRKLAEEE